MKTLCSAPAKLILSGEHSVLYNSSALSMAIELHTHCECYYTSNNTNSVTIELSDFNETYQFTSIDWHELATNIESRYTLFLDGNNAIQSVLSKPIDLIISILYHFDVFHSLKTGEFYFKIHSEIPVGRGLGSSASVIISVLMSLFKHHNLQQDKEVLLALARTIESRQHGRSSGIDPATILYGGLLGFHAKHPTQRHKYHELNAWLIDTGSPQSTTGQAVSYVKQHFGNDTITWKAFDETSQKITEAWSLQNTQTLLQGIAENQQLLEKIGVVPEPIKRFIEALKTQYQATAKICGSGAIKGDHAGVILCFSRQAPSQLCEAAGYDYQKITVNQQGAICQTL